MTAVVQLRRALYTAPMDKVTRRSFVTAVGAATLLPVAGRLGDVAAERALPVARSPLRTPADAPYRFFDAAEARFVEAACERLIPADEAAPGARAAQVCRYLDGHLCGAWGSGEQRYRSGAWQPGPSASAARSQLAPGQLFRMAVRAINRAFEQRGTAFEQLSWRSQTEFLSNLQAGNSHLGVPGAAFFDMLLEMTAEGYFCHPLHGGSRDRLAWRISGFPGALAALS
jgi:gluconate 2-dehydrogenase gamma chain